MEFKSLVMFRWMSGVSSNLFILKASLSRGNGKKSGVKNQRTKQVLRKTIFTRNTNDAQLNSGGDRWSTPAAKYAQRFVSPVLPYRPF
ncbi:hypothetical protein TNCV_1423541 [Trichonephila clavipes]|nr:hypothetical protein TNCV_1423541 [Trichonephila clavipes]